MITKLYFLLLLSAVQLFASNFHLKFSEIAWRKTEIIYNNILKHPFNIELANGTLSDERFNYYQLQDKLYLSVFAKALSILAYKLDDQESIAKVIKFSVDCLEESNLSLEKTQKKTSMSPANFNYTNFLLATAAFKSREELAAALLPCFWIYREVASEMIKNSSANNPYQKWIKFYASEKYRNDVNDMIKIVNDLAEKQSEKTLRAMLHAYESASKFELNFWEDAYNFKM